MTVIIGDHDLYSQGETCLKEKILRVANVILHEDYVDGKKGVAWFKNGERTTVSVDLLMERDHLDIGLLELAEAVDLATYTPACLPSKGETVDGKGPFYIYGSKSLSYPEQRGTVEILQAGGRGLTLGDFIGLL